MNFRSALIPSHHIILVTLSIYKISEAQHYNLQNADGQEQIDQTENVTLISQSVLDEIDNSNAEENEDDSIKEKHEIPVLDYDVLSMEELT
uniref:hypothetical protein n=1 Tax=Flavobacterium sp. TaxID=239 RepID=UPI0040484046